PRGGPGYRPDDRRPVAGACGAGVRYHGKPAAPDHRGRTGEGMAAPQRGGPGSRLTSIRCVERRLAETSGNSGALRSVALFLGSAVSVMVRIDALGRSEGLLKRFAGQYFMRRSLALNPAIL